MQRIHRIVVLGGGSAGFLAAITLKKKVPHAQIVVIRSKQIGIIGVGEGTTVSVPNFLHGYLGLDPMEFHRAVRPTFKLGIRFLWGPRPYFNYTFSPQFNMQYKALPLLNGFYCDDSVEYACSNSSLMTEGKAFVRLPDGSPGIRNDVAYHMENTEFAEYLEHCAVSAGVEVQEGTVESVERGETGIKSLLLADGQRVAADLWVDCSGFVSLLLGKTLGEPFISFKPSLYCERAVVGGWKRDGEPILPYTTAQTMDSGWCWQIEHDDRINRGYVYAPDFISDEAAEAEFRAKNPKITQTRIVKFISGCYERSWVDNVVAIGNAAGFVEPLESTALFIICDESETLAESLLDCECQPGLTVRRAYNARFRQTWSDIRRFLALHYRYNTRLQTPFWEACVNEVDLAGAEHFVEYYAENGPSAIWRDTVIAGKDVFGFEGYLCMMVGMGVKYQQLRDIPESQRAIWRDIQRQNRDQARAGLTMEQALAAIRSPQWSCRRDFYQARYATA